MLETLGHDVGTDDGNLSCTEWKPQAKHVHREPDSGDDKYSIRTYHPDITYMVNCATRYEFFKACAQT